MPLFDSATIMYLSDFIYHKFDILSIIFDP
jgi:hypothetical protein